jgi:ribose 5-phosphate isomerase A
MSERANDTSLAKVQAAHAAAALVRDGMTVGLGSGTTSALVVRALGERVANEGLSLIGVPTSVATADLARSLRIPLRELNDVESLDNNLDGADEIDPSFAMIKGRGGALLREKIVASSARLRVTVVTPEKRVERLGVSAPVPVEVSSIGSRHIERRLREIAGHTTLRLAPDGSPYVTDGGNRIIDCRFATIHDPAALNAELHGIVGVFETGLFVGLCDVLLIGHADSVERSDSGVRPLPVQ